MKLAKYFSSIAIALLVLSLGAFAKDSNSGNFSVTDKVQVGSTELAPGDYKVEWSGPANDVQVVIMQHGKTVATTQGKVTNLQQPAPYNAVLTKQTNTGLQLDQIEFNHRTEAVQLGGE
jgi:hypothetical protein